MYYDCGACEFREYFYYCLTPLLKNQKKITREFIINDDEINDSERCSVRCKLFESVKRTRVPPTILCEKGGRQQSSVYDRDRGETGTAGRFKCSNLILTGIRIAAIVSRPRSLCIDEPATACVVIRFAYTTTSRVGYRCIDRSAVYVERLAVFLCETMSHETTI